jgi:hypothetical protein
VITWTLNVQYSNGNSSCNWNDWCGVRSRLLVRGTNTLKQFVLAANRILDLVSYLLAVDWTQCSPNDPDDESLRTSWQYATPKDDHRKHNTDAMRNVCAIRQVVVVGSGKRIFARVLLLLLLSPVWFETVPPSNWRGVLQTTSVEPYHMTSETTASYMQ